MSCGKFNPVIVEMKRVRNEGVKAGYEGKPKNNPYGQDAKLASVWSCGYDVGEQHRGKLPLSDICGSDDRAGRELVLKL